MRIYELADELNVNSAEILKVAKKLGIRRKYAISNLTPKQEEKLREFFKESTRKVFTQTQKEQQKEKPFSARPPAPKKKEPPYIDMGPALPEKYGKRYLVLLPRDPSTIYAYWEIDPKDSDGILILRVFEIDEKGADKYHFDTYVGKDSSNWYLNIPRSGARYRAELGSIKEGIFKKIVSSNVVLVPRNAISDEVDEEWMIVKEDLQKIIKQTGLDRESRSSLRKAQSEFRNILEMIKTRITSNVSSGSFVKKEKK